MLKYQKIIEQLTTEQKIGLLCDPESFTARETNYRGVPRVKFIELFDDTGITAEEAACSFEKDVIYELASERLKGVKGGVVMLPAANVRGVFGGKGMTEDPWLNSQYLSECVRAVKEHGALACYSLLSMREEDKGLTDDIVEKRAIMEYFFMPFNRIKTYEGNAVVCGADGADLLPFINGGNVDYKFVSGLCGSEAVKALVDGYVMSLGAFEPIQEALINYRRYAREAKEGELESLCKEGEALSEEMLDEFVERAIEFAFNCASSEEEDKKGEDDKFEKQSAAARKSIVLLKNSKNLLPVKKDNKIAVIAAHPSGLASALESAAPSVAIRTDYKEGALAAVSKGLADCNVAVLVLKVENDVLSTEEKRIINLLKDEGVKIIAVLPSDFSGSVRFLDLCDALLLSPDPTKFYRALASVLIGEYSPGGRTTCSLYDDVFEEIKSINAFKKIEENRIGSFIGYRRYDEMPSTVKYPFGYGLSYDRFYYSDLSVKGREISFTLRNEGQIDGEEVVEIYVGKNDSAVIRPKKELKYCVKVFVKAGRSTRVKIKIPNRGLEVYSQSKRDWIEEGGKYEVYVCASSAKVKLTGAMFIHGVKLESDNSDRYVYSTAQSNIVGCNYVYGVKTKRKINAVQIILAVLFGMITIFGTLVTAGVLPNSEGWSMLIGLIIVSVFAPLFILMIVLASVGGGDASQIRVPIKNVKPRRLNSELSSLFEEAFGEDTPQDHQAAAEEAAFTEIEEDAFTEMIEGADLTELVDKIVASAASRGIGVSRRDAQEYLAAMAASRLVIVKNSDLIYEFGNAVTEALGGKHFYETDAFTRSLDLITNDSGIDLRPTEDALLTSAAHPDVICMLTLAPAIMEKAEMLKPFVEYFANPKGHGRLKFDTVDGEKSCQLSCGVWVMLAIGDEFFDNIPSYVSKYAVFPTLDLTETEAKEKTECKKIPFEQLEESFSNLGKVYSLSEENWKKIDKFIDYASAKIDFSLGNRGFLALERYFSIMLMNGEDETTALDYAVAHALLPRFISLSREASAVFEENLADALGRIFGENNVAVCEEVLNSSLLVGSKPYSGE